MIAADHDPWLIKMAANHYTNLLNVMFLLNDVSSEVNDC